MVTPGKVIENSYYPILIDQLKKHTGATSVSQVRFNSVPDIMFELPQLPGTKWLLSVKIGDDPQTLTSAFIQFQRHKDESQSDYGVILFLPKSARNVEPDEKALNQFIEAEHVWAIVDTPWVKEENRQLPFPQLVQWLIREVTPRIKKGETTPFTIPTILTALRQQVGTLMSALKLGEQDLLKLITDEKLFSHFSENTTVPKEAAQFLAAYTFLSQILFFHMFAEAHPAIIPPRDEDITRANLRKAFGKILEIDYKQVYETDVLNDIPDQFMKDTYILLRGLAISRVRADIGVVDSAGRRHVPPGRPGGCGEGDLSADGGKSVPGGR